MHLYSYLARTSRLGLATALGTALVAMALCVVFELLVPAQRDHVASYLGQKNLNFRFIVLYATAGGIHILLCLAGIIFFLTQLNRSESKLEFKRIVIGILAGTLIVFSIVLVACYLDINLVEQSYHERIRPLQHDPRLSYLTAKRSVAFLKVEFVPFVLFPLALVGFGVAVAVASCFWIAQNAISFANAAHNLKKHQIVAMKRCVTQLITLTSLVFTTSTIATVALMQIGRDWIEKGNAKEAYIQNGDAMSIFWSACYTCVTATIVMIPLCWIVWYTKPAQRQAKYSGNRATFYDQIFEVISLKSISQAGVAMLAPVLTSIIAAVFGS